MNHENYGRIEQTNRGLFRVGGISAYIQLVCVIGTLIVVILLGSEPATPEEYFTVLSTDRLVGFLRLDLFSLVNVMLFVFTSFAIFAAIRREKDLYPALFIALIFVGVAIAASTHSAASMIHLSERYAAAFTDAERQMLTAAAEAVIARDWWHTTGGLMAGIFLQGGMTLLLLSALSTGWFSKWMCYAGILANGLDFVHIFAGFISEPVGIILLSIGGLFYLIWYPLLGIDLIKLASQPVQV